MFCASGAHGSDVSCSQALRKRVETTSFTLSFWKLKDGVPTKTSVAFDSAKFSRIRDEIAGQDYAQLILSGVDLETRLSALDRYIERSLGEPFVLFVPEKEALRRSKKILKQGAKVLLDAKPSPGFIDRMTELFLRANPDRRDLLRDYKWSSYIRDRIKARFFASLLARDLGVSATKGAKVAAIKNISITLALNAFALKWSGLAAAGLPSLETIRMTEIPLDSVRSILEKSGGFSEEAYDALYEQLQARGKFDYGWKWAVLISSAAVLSYFTYSALFPDMTEEEKQKLVHEQVDEFYNEAANEAKASLKTLEEVLSQPELTKAQRDSVEHKIAALKSLVE